MPSDNEKKKKKKKKRGYYYIYSPAQTPNTVRVLDKINTNMVVV